VVAGSLKGDVKVYDLAEGKGALLLALMMMMLDDDDAGRW
jgi:hypothetical protein